MSALRLDGKNLILPLAILMVGLTLLLALTQPVVVLGADPNSAPDPPGGLTGAAVHAGIVDVEWDEAAGAESYEVQVMTGSEWIALPGGGMEITFYGPGAIVGDLPYEGRYFFRVRSVNAAGTSDWSISPLISATGGPGQWEDVPELTNSAATGAPAISGRLRVGKPLSASTSGMEDENGLERVRCHYQWISNGVEVNGAEEATYTLAAADQGKDIRVRVSFTDRRGYSESLTSGATGAVGPPPVAPGKPRNLEVTRAAHGEVELAWEPPESDGGSEITGYKVMWRSRHEAFSTSRQALENGLSHTIRGLAGAREYTVSVLAINDAGAGEKVEVASRVPGVIPNSPSGLTATAVHAGVLDVEWDEAAGADSYEVQVMPGDEWVALPGEGMQISFYGPGAIVGNLPHEGRYFFKVRALNQLGTSEWSSRLFTPATGDSNQWEGAPVPTNSTATGVPSINGQARVGEILTADIRGIQDGNGLDRVKFHYQWILRDGDNETDIDNAGEASYRVDSAAEGKTVKVRVSFTDRGGFVETPLTSTATAEVKPPYSIPSAPQNLSLSPGEGKIEASWEAPDSDGDKGVTAYRVQWKSGSEDYDLTRTADVSRLTYTVRGLRNELEYTVRVAAVNEVGFGPPSEEAVASPHNDTPPELLATEVTGLRLALTYSDALDAASVPSTSTFEVLLNGIANPVTNVSVEGNSVSLTLTDSVTWDDAVSLKYTPPQDSAASRIQDRWGQAAAAIDNMDVTPSLETPSPPRNVAVSADQVSRLTLSWDAPESNGGSAVIEYVVQWRKESDPYGPSTEAAVVGSTYTINSLDDERAYGLRVLARNAVGDGSPSDEILATVGSEIDVDVHGDTIEEATLLPKVLRRPGTIYPPSDEDFFRIEFTGEEAGMYLYMNEARPYKRHRFTLLDSDGNCVWDPCVKDDGAGGRSSGVIEPGTYYLRVQSPTNYEIGEDLLDKWRYEVGWRPHWNDFHDRCPAIETEFSDPYYGCQKWKNGDLTKPFQDINAEPVWKSGILGQGILVNVIDSGIDPEHEDIKPNLDLSRSTKIYGTNRYHDLSEPYGYHGTAIAGVIAARDNSVGMRGVAPRARVYSTYFSCSFFCSSMSGFNSNFFTREMDETAVSNNSYVSSQGLTHGDTSSRWEMYARIGVKKGFHGKGISHVFGSPNSPVNGNVNEMANYYAVIGITGVDRDGSLHPHAAYGDYLWVSAPFESLSPSPHNSYGYFSGNSNATPVVSGVVALIRSANESLTWRDVKLILAASARKNLPGDAGWETGSLQYRSDSQRYTHHRNFGFGIVDAGAAVELAQSWSNLPPMKSETAESGQLNLTAPDAVGGTQPTVVTSELVIGEDIEFIEFVQVNVAMDHTFNRDLLMELVSPTGRVTMLTQPVTDEEEKFFPGARARDRSHASNRDFRFGSAKHLGEDPTGTWTLRMSDHVPANTNWKLDSINGEGGIKEWSITIYGHSVDGTPNRSATGEVQIDGAAQEGGTLTANTDGIADADGSENAEHSYQWYSFDGTINDKVSGATGARYTLSDQDVGNEISVLVTFTDDAGHHERLTSARTAPVPALPNNPATGEPTISGIAQEGVTLTVSTSGISDADGLDGAEFTYQWLANDADIEGATGSTYALTGDDVGNTIKVKVSFTDDRDHEESLTSAATAAVSARPNNPAAGQLVISGYARSGESLTANTEGISDTDGLNNVDFSYQWLADDVDMEGATGPTFTLTDDQVGKTIRVRVTFTDNKDSDETLTSEPTATVGVAFIDGTPGTPALPTMERGDQQLTVTWTPPEDNGTVPVSKYLIEFRRTDRDYLEGRRIELPAATLTRTITDLANGTTYHVRVTAANADGYGSPSEEASAAPGTGDVAGLATPLLSDPEVLHHRKVKLDWQDVVGSDRYEVQLYDYRAGGFVDLPNGDVEIVFDGSSAVVSGLPEGNLWFLKVRAVNTGGESEWSEIVQIVPTKASDWEEDDNSPATGAPTISGTSQAGETLTASTSDIADADGLINVSYSYQWLADDAEMEGATSSTYTLTDSEVGKAIKVRVAFTDDADNEETLTSAATAQVTARPNSPATGAPTISGTAQVGETLTASTTDIADADGLTNVVYSYQWLADDAEIDGATSSTYTLTDEDVGKSVKVRVTFTDDADNEETLTSAATAEVSARPNDPATGAPTIRGTVQAGETLTAETSGIADADGLNNFGFSYQWIADDAEIEGATSSTYTLTDDEVGKAIKVRVTFTDDADNEETLTSAATAAVSARPNSPATGLPTISGMAQAGESLTADVSGITDADGLGNVEFAYQWLADDAAISGATDSTYTLTDDEVGKAIRVRVTFTDDRGADETLTSAPTESVTVLVWSATLTAGSGGTYSGYDQYQGTGALSDDEFSLAAIEYSVRLVTEDDEGMLSLVLDRPLLAPFTLHVGTFGFASEDATPEEGDGADTYGWDKGTVEWSDGEQVELSLTLSDLPLFGVFAGVPDAHDGQTVFTFELLFSREPRSDFSYRTLKDHAFTVTGGTVTRTPRLGPPSNMSWEIHVRPDSDGDVTVVLPVTEDCSAQGAICTEDGRPLSNRLEVTVRGPLDAGQNTEATGVPTISGTAQAGETLTAVTTGIADSDGLTNVSYSHQWLADDADIPGATDSTYTLTDDEVGKAIKVKVSFTDDADNEESLTSTATAQVTALPNSPATGAPTISGTAQAGETLTAVTTGIADADGLDNVSYSHQWLADDADIPGATDSSYTLTDDEVGKAIKVKVSFTDDRNNEETLTSTATAAVTARPNSPATGEPSISGTAQARETLTANISAIVDADGLANVDFSYQWLADDADIQDASDSTYTLTDDEVGKAIKVKVTFTDDAQNEETLTSAGTGTEAVTAKANTPATGAPTISGGAQAGQTLTAQTSGITDSDGLTNVSYSHQWLADDAEIQNATDSTYTLTDDEVGKAIKVKVSFTDDRDNEESLTSAATAQVTALHNNPATGAPTISGTAQAGETLTAVTTGIADADGLSNVSYSHQWLADDADISGATDSTYTLTDDEVGKAIKVKVSFTDDRNNEESLTSAATAQVTALHNNPATGAPTISGTVQSGETLTASTDGIADADGLDSVSYSHQWLADDADISGATDSTYTLTDDDVGKTIKVKVSFTDDRNNDETLTSAATGAVAARPDSSDTDAQPGDPSTTVDVTVGDTVKDEIEELHEVDWFRVHLLASESYRIDMRGAWGGEWALVDGEIVWISAGTLEDPKLLGVYSGANVLVPGTDEEVSGDDRGDYAEGKNSRIKSFSPPADGYYYIAAAAEQGGWTGTYELTVTVATEE